jgi:short-subunit dehydrogenase
MSAVGTKGSALITGASSGIGAVYADRLAKRGYDLILVARNQNQLATLAHRLKIATGRSVETMAADLSDKADVARIETELHANASVTLLVNNAGVGATAPIFICSRSAKAQNGRMPSQYAPRGWRACMSPVLGYPGSRRRRSSWSLLRTMQSR